MPNWITICRESAIRKWPLAALLPIWAFLWLIAFIGGVWIFASVKPMWIAVDQQGSLPLMLAVIASSIPGLAMVLFATGAAKLVGQILTKRLLPDA